MRFAITALFAALSLSGLLLLIRARVFRVLQRVDYPHPRTT